MDLGVLVSWCLDVSLGERRGRDLALRVCLGVVEGLRGMVAMGWSWELGVVYLCVVYCEYSRQS